MGNDASRAPSSSSATALWRARLRDTLTDGLWKNNPISIQVLGICSALAVTTRLENSLYMGAALVFVMAMTNVFVSILRKTIPRRIRMITEVAIISTFVIVFDRLLKAYYPSMSRQLGVYVPLIITNCIVMGRAEAFALHNPPFTSAVDGLSNGLGYAFVICLVGAVRELLGTGCLLGCTVLQPGWYTPNHLMILAPGAFFAMGFLIAIFNSLGQRGDEEEQP